MEEIKLLVAKRFEQQIGAWKEAHAKQTASYDQEKCFIEILSKQFLDIKKCLAVFYDKAIKNIDSTVSTVLNSTLGYLYQFILAQLIGAYEIRIQSFATTLYGQFLSQDSSINDSAAVGSFCMAIDILTSLAFTIQDADKISVASNNISISYRFPQ